MNRFIVGIMLFKVRTMLCLGPLVWLCALSPSVYLGSGAYIWGVDGGDGYFYSYFVDIDFGVRPSLSLQSGVKISSGNGSATSPYKIAV